MVWLDFCGLKIMIKNYIFCTFLLVLTFSLAQENKTTLVKGKVIESLVINDSLNESVSLYLPTSFEMNKSWPLLLVTDLKEDAVGTVKRFSVAAEKNKYILVAPNSLSDTASISNNILKVKNALDFVFTILPIDRKRFYAGGIGYGGRFASLVPVFIKDVDGVLSINGTLANMDLLSVESKFHFIGLTTRENYSYTQMLVDEKILNARKFPNNLIVYDGSEGALEVQEVVRALTYFDMALMKKEEAYKDSLLINHQFQADLNQVYKEQKEGNYLLAHRDLLEMEEVYRDLVNTDTAKSLRKELRKDKNYRVLKRMQEGVLFNEGLKKEDFAYYVEEDLQTYNYNNLGWWNYKLSELKKDLSNDNPLKVQSAKRLIGYVNALVDDQVDIIKHGFADDVEALLLAHMLKTITAPENYDSYLKVISISAKNEDFGTAIYYLEELLKNGYKDKGGLYQLENTALLRITPEFNALLEQYLGDAIYSPLIKE
jgi:hypothetical protein